MADKIEYSIADLHNLFELGLRKSMFSNTKSDMHQVAIKNKDSIIKNGNPVYIYRLPGVFGKWCLFVGRFPLHSLFASSHMYTCTLQDLFGNMVRHKKM